MMRGATHRSMISLQGRDWLLGVVVGHGVAVPVAAGRGVMLKVTLRNFRAWPLTKPLLAFGRSIWDKRRFRSASPKAVGAEIDGVSIHLETPPL
jgi:hypothetical protein